MRTIGRFLSTVLFILILTAQQLVFAGGGGIPLANNLADTARLSSQQGLPTIVFVSRDACPYCRTLRDSILEPMLEADKFKQRANLVEVSLDRDAPMTGFDGRLMTAKAFGELYNAGITPTLLFLDDKGREISKRRIGISNLDLYGHYLQKSIDEALLVTRARVQQ